MNTVIKALLRVLRCNITINDKVVPVVKRNYPLDKTPCVILENSGGSNTLNKYRLNLHYPTSDDQVCDVLKTEKNITVQVHVYCNNEDERENINNQIISLFNMTESDHYLLCENYHEGNCKTLNSECKAINNKFSRGIKGQCPKPSEYDYKNIYTTYNLNREKCNWEEHFEVDDLNTEPITLHSVFKVNANYYTYHQLGGNISKNIELKE